jgi:ubiquinone/menaquinone biosynthesis C-methylase UbiE
MKNYNEEFNEWHSKLEIDFNVSTPWHKYFIHNAQDFVSKGDKILEIGCGRGGFAFWLSPNFSEIYGQYEAADFSKSAVEMAQKYQKKNSIKYINFSVQDIQNINFPDNSFDKIISFETIEHVPDPQKAVKELYRVLKPDGKLILTTPNYMNFYGLYRAFLRLTGRRWTEVGQPINNFVIIPRTLFWLKFSGFVVRDFSSSEFSTPWLNKRVHHFKFKTAWWNKLFGLQSFFLATKKSD